jgi:hypothetical protein
MTCAMSASTSLALAPGPVTMKFACIRETSAPPMRAPLSPAASMSAPAEVPGGLVKTDPQLGRLSG